MSKPQKKTPPLSFDSVDFQGLFQSLPQQYIAFLPDDPKFTIVAENDAHAKVAMVSQRETIGQPLFDVFPDTSDKYRKTGVSDLIESLRRVIKTGKPDTMPTLRYDLRDKSGKMVRRYWRLTHYPLFDPAGKLLLIYQATEDITDEIVAGRELEQIQQQLDNALSVGLIGLWTWDITGNRVFADKNLAHMFGVSPEKAAAGLPLSAFTQAIHKDDRDRVMEEIDRAVQAGGAFESEYRTNMPGGDLRWVIARGRILENKAGEAISFPGVIVDITERKQAEESLEESRRSFLDLADAMPQLVWISDAKGNVEYFNKQWYEYTGTTVEQFQTESWTGLVVHPDDLPITYDAWFGALKNGTTYEVEYRLREGKTGTYRWFIGRAVPMRNSKGVVTKWYGTSTDINEQKLASDRQHFLSEATKKLASSLDYHKTLQRIAKLSVPTIADWCTVEMFNDEHALEQVVVAHKDPDMVAWARKLREKQGPPDLRSDANAGIGNVIKTGEPFFAPHVTEEMYAASAKSKEELDILRNLGLSAVIIVPLRVQGETVGVISFIAVQNRFYTQNDLMMAQELAARASLAITNAHLYEGAQKELAERKRLQEELRLANEELEQRVANRTAQLEDSNTNLERSNQELQNFAYVASHDLQEPLRKIQAFGNLLEQEFGRELGDGRDYLGRMRSAAARMSILIEDLLALSRVTTKARPFQRVDLAKVVAEVTDDLETRLADTKGTLNVGKLPAIDADPTQMRQLFQNLISNALKFHREGVAPKVSIAAKTIKQPDGNVCELTITDNGIGFDEKYLDRIFAVFQRLHTRDTYEGTGIGLAVCRKITERHGGTINAHSAPGKGSTFIVTLPTKHKQEISHDE